MNKSFRLALLTVPLLQLAACDLNEPTWVSPSRVEVHEEGFSDTFDTASLDDSTLRAIGANYYRYGNGPMDVVVSYDPKSKTNTAAKANAQVKMISSELGKYGVKNLRITTSAIDKSGDKSNALISFPALTARPPEGCGVMPVMGNKQTDMPDTAVGNPPPYQLGCTIESMMAKQVVRPGDLLGRPGFETNADGRRQEAVIWQRGYYGNTAFPPLQGQNASAE